ncbi:tripartite tricarboxylate transporter substrate binding protein [Lampropedia aestuarii]|uniref:Tripartite tricarboxylate transporter substrate binding protein n=1 Tax=Lampropedia aestuarii TaxID=2562762 RepID=A0A4S5BRC1_9BURK|nr:tripartite tricarboxylate transporter substrate binding protein [Lampropedia aestuarii]THJ33485.1 tripartite tricarboxylate transporter substrate binding protein [Lampropedia aestuarii]
MPFRTIARLATLALTVAASTAFAAGDYPSKPIRIIVPIAAGGATDVQARAMAHELQKHLNTSVVVENRPGGNFVIGNVAVATAPADGYTIGWALSAAMSLNPLLYKNLAYQPTDFQYLAPVSKGHHVIAIPASAKANTLQEWIDDIKQSGKPAAVAVSSVGGTTHLMAADIARQGQFKVEPVLYRGEAPAVQDLVANQVPAMSGIVASVLQYYTAGKVKILAISSEERISELPDVPTFKELGYPFVGTYWNGMVAPARTPQPIVDKLSEAIRTVVQSPEFRAKLSNVPDMHAIEGPPEMMADMIAQDTVFWSRIINENNISIEQ